MMNPPRTFSAVSADRMMALDRDLYFGSKTFLNEMVFEHRLDHDRLYRALELLFKALPILGCSFVDAAWRPYWEEATWSREEIFYVTESRDRLEQFKLTNLPAGTGPQVRLCLFTGSSEDRLLAKCNHLVCDGRRFDYVLRVLSSIYTRLAVEPGFLPEENMAYRGSRALFARIPLAAWPRIIGNTARTMLQEQKPCLALRPPYGPKDPAAHAVRHLPCERVLQLRAYARSRNATMSDMLLAAYFRSQVALTEWNGQCSLRLTYLVDLKSSYLPEDTGTAVTNLIGLDSACLATTLGAAFDDTLERVHAATSRRKRDWHGFNQLCFIPLWKYAPFNLQTRVLFSLMRKKIDSGKYPNIFSNRGVFPDGALTFDRPPVRAWGLSAVQYPPLMMVLCTSYRNELTLSTGTTASALPFVQHFYDQLLQELPA